MNAEEKQALKEKLNSDEHNAEYLFGAGWTLLTDWTFTSITPLQSLLREGEELIKYYCKKGPYNKFNIQFCSDKGCTYLWGKLEEDYSI